jgi:peptidoglycan/LPS O-acetylase OafA/YrhL
MGTILSAVALLIIVQVTREPIVVTFAAGTLAVGFALILGAFGTWAKGHFTHLGWVWTVGGPGAMAFLLFCGLESYLKPGFTKFGRIEISHPDYSKVADFRIIDGRQP